MISKYNKFKEDLLLESLVNESFLYFSPDLISVISKVGGDISDDLISVELTDIKPDITFVDIDKEGYLSFTTMRNAAKTLAKAYPPTGEEEWGNEVIDRIDRNAIWMRHQNGGEDDVYNKSRNSVKIGKFINKLLTGKYKDKDVEEFVNKFKAAIENKGEKFEIVDGDDIAFWYKSENYAENRGTLGSSCMSEKNNIFNIYTKNPEVCRMLILKEDDKILGRALVWKLNSIKKFRGDDLDVDYFMDRQYTIKDSDVEKFRNYAKEQKNWVSKANNNHHSFEPILIHKGGDEVINVYMTVKVKKVGSSDSDYDYAKYPYLDTFRRFDPRTGILENDENQGSDEEGCYILESTDGGYTEVEGGYWSEWHDRHIPEDDAIYSDVYGDWLYRDQAINVSKGSRTGVYHQDDDYIIYDENIDEYIHQDDAVYSEAYSHYIYDETAVRVIVEIQNNGDIDGDGDWYPEGDDDIIKIDKDKTWFEFLDSKYRYWDDFDYILKSSSIYKSSGWIKDDIMIKNSDGDWIPKIFSVELYKIIPTNESVNIEVEYLNKLDAKILKYKIDEEDSILTDQFQYHEDIKDHLIMIYKRINTELSGVWNKLKNKSQLRLKFDEDDDTKYRKELKEKKKDLIKRSDQIEDGDFIEGIEIPDLELDS
jgi:hypothetical protein